MENTVSLCIEGVVDDAINEKLPGENGSTMSSFLLLMGGGDLDCGQTTGSLSDADWFGLLCFTA